MNSEAENLWGSVELHRLAGVLVFAVDDDPMTLETIKRALTGVGARVECFHSPRGLLKHLAKDGEKPDVILTDLKMEGMDGVELLDHLKEKGLLVPGIVITAEGTVSEAVHAMKHGAFDFLTKPFPSIDALFRTVSRAVQFQSLRAERDSLMEDLRASNDHHLVAGISAKMRRVVELAEVVSKTGATVLLTGETGTGKELVARFVHELSGRKRGKFVAINCGALAPNVLESELFGHAKGAFTGAGTTRAGLFLAASEGTLFLDEVSELEMSMQVKLLRVLQESEVRPVGADRSIPINTRVIAATNRPLSQMVARGQMREDLFYRLNVFEIVVPPLRERVEDIQPLSAHLLRKHSIKLGRSPPAISQEALEVLTTHPWPGNVRQLENVLERALIICDDSIEARHLETIEQRELLAEPGSSSRRIKVPIRDTDSVPPLRSAKEEFERNYLIHLLRLTSNNRSEAARLARLDPSNLRRLLKRHGLDR